jgi:hypothetical protein
MSTLKADTLVAADGTSPVTLTKQQAAKHFVWFDGNTSNAIENSFNTSSVTDSGTGDYRPVLTSAMSSTFSVLTAMSYRTSRYTCTGSGVSMTSTTVYELDCANSSTSFTDTEVGATLDGDLA